MLNFEELGQFEEKISKMIQSLKRLGGKKYDRTIKNKEFKSTVKNLDHGWIEISTSLKKIKLSEKLEEISKIFRDINKAKDSDNPYVKSFLTRYQRILLLIDEYKHEEIENFTELFDKSVLEKLPKDVFICLDEANRCFIHDCYIACSVMIRKALETAIIIKFLQTDHQSDLHDDQGNEINLERKLNLLSEFTPKIRRDVDDIKIVKWFGDKGAHDSKTPIFVEDIKDNIAPKMRSFLINLELKI